MTTETHATRAGAVDLGSGKKQHVDLFRKIGIRRDLLEHVGQEGAAYVPFLGEGDIAAELYAETRQIVGIELDPDVAHLAADRLTKIAAATSHIGPRIIVGDAEVWHPEAAGETVRSFAVLDVDAFSNPYVALEVAWRELAPRPSIDVDGYQHDGLADRVAIFGTDGMRLAIRRSKSRMLAPLPAGEPLRKTDNINERRAQWNGWWPIVLAYLEQLVTPATIIETRKYVRDHMLYWGIVVDRTSSSRSAAGDEAPPSGSARNAGPAGDIAAVEAALLEAAKSGNVPAAMFYLEHKGGPTWAKDPGSPKRHSRLDEILAEHEIDDEP